MTARFTEHREVNRLPELIPPERKRRRENQAKRRPRNLFLKSSEFSLTLNVPYEPRDLSIPLMLRRKKV
jgi:hypothetical protein